MPTKRSALTPAFGWQPNAKRYVNLSTGRYVSWERTVRPALDAVLDKAKGRIEELARKLNERDSNIPTLQALLAHETKQTIVIGHSLAAGGWGQLTQADYGRMGFQCRQALVKIRDLCIQIEDGRQPRNGRLVDRARSMAGAGRVAYEDERRRLELTAGKTRERSVRHFSDSCSQCISEAERGFVLIGHLIPIGKRLCGFRCHCTIIYE